MLLLVHTAADNLSSNISAPKSSREIVTSKELSDINATPEACALYTHLQNIKLGDKFFDIESQPVLFRY